MEANTTDKKGIALDEICISPVGSINSVIHQLRTQYPGAYNLRETVSNPIVISGKEKGLLFVVNHDDEHSNPQYTYVLWNGIVFSEISSNSVAARIVNKNGIFFLSEKETWHKVRIEHKKIFPNTEKKFFVSEETHMFHTVTNMYATEHGFFLEGHQEDNQERHISFFDSHSRSDFLLPYWANHDTWKPGQENTIYFSDETAIYLLEAGEKKEAVKVAGIKDPAVRLGRTHQWVVVPKHNMQPELFESSKVKDTFLVLDMHHGAGYFADGTKMPYGFPYAGFNHSWIPFHQGFIKIWEHGPGLDLYFYSLKNDEWGHERFFRIDNVNNREGTLFQKDPNTFVLGVKEQRYLFTWEMIQSILAL